MPIMLAIWITGIKIWFCVFNVEKLGLEVKIDFWVMECEKSIRYIMINDVGEEKTGFFM